MHFWLNHGIMPFWCIFSMSREMLSIMQTSGKCKIHNEGFILLLGKIESREPIVSMQCGQHWWRAKIGRECSIICRFALEQFACNVDKTVMIKECLKCFITAAHMQNLATFMFSTVLSWTLIKNVAGKNVLSCFGICSVCCQIQAHTFAHHHCFISKLLILCNFWEIRKLTHTNVDMEAGKLTFQIVPHWDIVCGIVETICIVKMFDKSGCFSLIPGGNDIIWELSSVKDDAI